MPVICYMPKRFNADTLSLIKQVDEICQNYARQGYDLSVRQVFYQLVVENVISNTEQSYNRVICVVNDARLAGLLDWNYIADRTRNLETNSHWDNPEEIIDSSAYSFRLDKWEGQEYYCEIWVEKQALAGIVQRTAKRLDISCIACKGYMSQSEMWTSAQRYKKVVDNGQIPIIIHLGDHDPSGIDMTRDIRDRLALLMTDGWDDYRYGGYDMEDPYEKRCAQTDYQEVIDNCPLEVKRVALNIDQVRQYNPPHNPTKLSDTRSSGYISKFGSSCWELDALDPATLDRVITTNVLRYRDEDKFNQRKEEEEKHRKLLKLASTNWSRIEEMLQDELDSEEETENGEEDNDE